ARPGGRPRGGGPGRRGVGCGGPAPRGAPPTTVAPPPGASPRCSRYPTPTPPRRLPSGRIRRRADGRGGSPPPTPAAGPGPGSPPRPSPRSGRRRRRVGGRRGPGRWSRGPRPPSPERSPGPWPASPGRRRGSGPARRSSPVLRVSGQQLEGVVEDRQDGGQRLRGASGGAGQVDHQRRAHHPGDRPRQGGHGRGFETRRQDEVYEAGRRAVDHLGGRLGGDVSGPEPGAAGGDHEVGLFGGGEDGVPGPVLLVGDDAAGHRGCARSDEHLGQGVAGVVGAGSVVDAIGDRDDVGTPVSHRGGPYMESTNGARSDGGIRTPRRNRNCDTRAKKTNQASGSHDQPSASRWSPIRTVRVPRAASTVAIVNAPKRGRDGTSPVPPSGRNTGTAKSGPTTPGTRAISAVKRARPEGVEISD